MECTNNFNGGLLVLLRIYKIQDEKRLKQEEEILLIHSKHIMSRDVSSRRKRDGNNSHKRRRASRCAPCAHNSYNIRYPGWTRISFVDISPYCICKFHGNITSLPRVCASWVRVCVPIQKLFFLVAH